MEFFTVVFRNDCRFNVPINIDGDHANVHALFLCAGQQLPVTEVKPNQIYLHWIDRYGGVQDHHLGLDHHVHIYELPGPQGTPLPFEVVIQ